MTAYAIFQENIHDQHLFESYKKIASVTIKAHGGEFLARGGKFRVMEGKSPHDRFVVIGFPDWDAAMRWYNSTEYHEAKLLRQSISDGCLVIVEGMP